MLHDIHQNKRKKLENCESCRFYFATPVGDHGNCHRFPPPSAVSGHVTVYPLGWCGEYAEDPEKMVFLKEHDKDHFDKRKEHYQKLVEDHHKRGKELKASRPDAQATIAREKLK